MLRSGPLSSLLALTSVLASALVGCAAPMETATEDSASAIHGGQAAADGPRSVALLSGPELRTCNGILVARRAVLTSSGCMERPDTEFNVSFPVNGAVDGARGIVITSKRQRFLPDARGPLALVILDKSPAVEPAALPRSAPARGAPVTLYGYGPDDERRTPHAIMHFLQSREIRYRQASSAASWWELGAPVLRGNEVVGIVTGTEDMVSILPSVSGWLFGTDVITTLAPEGSAPDLTTAIRDALAREPNADQP